MMIPKTVAITGGMGSGKTTVVNYFIELGIPAYVADDRAKQLMQTNKELIASIKFHFGDDAYNKDHSLNKDYLADKVFCDSDQLKKLNQLVHPAVRKDFKEWLNKQNSAYVIYESALIFEHDQQDSFDYIILVTAPEHLRIKRIQKRNNWTVKQIQNRMKKQMDDNLKRDHVNYIIENVEKELIKNEVFIINKKILKIIY